MNTVINFGDSLESHVIGAATDHAKKADLVLALGSTLRVTPACELVEMGKKPVRLVLCNRYIMFYVNTILNLKFWLWRNPLQCLGYFRLKHMDTKFFEGESH